MARPREYEDRLSTSLRLSPALMKELQAVARERDVSVNHIIVRAIEDYLPRLLPVDELLRTQTPQAKGV